MKQLFKNLVIRILRQQVRRLRNRRKFELIAIGGSIGKTSTKFAIAQVLSAKHRVQFQKGNYNDVVTVPLVFFGLPLPSLTNPIAWLVTFIRIEAQLMRPYPYDVVVVELGTDGPGQLARDFGSYLRADIGVVTAITPEHMEFFGTLQAVAKEELTIGDISDTLLLNTDLCPQQFVPKHPSLLKYGTDETADYHLGNMRLTEQGYDFAVHKQGQTWLQAMHETIARPQLYSLAAAVAVADQLGMGLDDMRRGINGVEPVPGRMQLLHGVKGSVLIDDSYNASPEAMKGALRTLYDMPQRGGQKIALLGNMNELGEEFSPGAHTEIGALCDPRQVSYVVTLGPDANNYLAPAAERAGCLVRRCESPYEAAEFIQNILEDGATILIKGSQNRVFAEETVRMLLADPTDATRLVRQSPHWMAVKRGQFTDFPVRVNEEVQ